MDSGSDEGGSSDRGGGVREPHLFPGPAPALAVASMTTAFGWAGNMATDARVTISAGPCGTRAGMHS